MTTTLTTATAMPAAAAAALRAAVAPTPPAARLRAAVVMPSVLAPVAVSSSAVWSATRVSVVADVPAIDGSWSRGRGDFGTAKHGMANYGTTINAQAAKHGKAVGPPRGTSV